MSIIGSNILAGSSGQGGAYEIEQSLRFNSGDTHYLNRTPGSAGNRRTWTWSGWVKRAKLGDDEAIFSGGASNPITTIRFSGEGSASPDGINIFHYAGSFSFQLTTTAQYRDLSSWYHIVVACDTTQATASNRLKLYVNGTQVTTFDTETYPSQNFDTEISNTSTQTIGRNGTGSNYLNGYQAEVNFIDGSALDPTDFGEFDDNGVWRPIEYAGSYTGNSFYLKFASGDGTDSSGLSNTWTANNFTTSGTGTDVMSDTPTTNYATLNAIDPIAVTFSEGNLKATGTNNWETARSTIAMTTGKWYWEVTPTHSSSYVFAGVVNKSANITQYVGQNANGWAFRTQTGQIYNNASGTTYGSATASGVVLGFAFDADTGKMWVRNASGFFNSGDPAAGTNPAMTAGAGEYYVGLSAYETSASNTANFGQRDFAYTPPTGFKALNTANLPAPDIADGSDYFNTVLYTGNGSTQSITGVGFQPDWVWIKRRDGIANHGLYDSVRGATKALVSSSTAAEVTDANSLTSFDSDGFSANDPVSTAPNLNVSGQTYAAWNWKADNTSGSSNTAGSITSTVSANPSAGFSIVSYTGNGTSGATVGHGLGVAPQMIIVKQRNGTFTWRVYHVSLANTQVLYLSATDAATTETTAWNSTTPTSTTFTLGTSSGTNGNTNTYIAYCFAEVEGYSKFGSYIGNGSTDGPFVYCGFRPAWVMIKRSDGTGEWFMVDTPRNPYNPADDDLFANASTAETASSGKDLLSNGFKIRENGASMNASGGTFIFMAFAENPFGGSGVSPATAR